VSPMPTEVAMPQATVPATFGSCSPPEVVLELCGEGVLEVPYLQRCLGPVNLETPLVVGRKHQPDFLRQAIAKECLQFLSREHFSIAWQGADFRLHAMTSNPIWIYRGCEIVGTLAQHDTAELRSGDRIALGTGGDGLFTTAEEAFRRLNWHFRQVGAPNLSQANSAGKEPIIPGTQPWVGSCPSSPAGAAVEVIGTQPWTGDSPGTLRQRDSDIAPWAWPRCLASVAQQREPSSGVPTPLGVVRPCFGRRDRRRCSTPPRASCLPATAPAERRCGSRRGGQAL